eukprot:jgi/Botrbrau1/1206/Bobra.0163s0014.1
MEGALRRGPAIGCHHATHDVCCGHHLRRGEKPFFSQRRRPQRLGLQAQAIAAPVAAVPKVKGAVNGVAVQLPQGGNVLPRHADPEPSPSGFHSIEAALLDIAAGRFVVVLDDEDRENEGDLIIAADKVTPEAMHFMVEHTSGVVCVGMEGRDLDRLALPLMVPSRENEEAMSTAFTITVDAREGTSTGISAEDRSRTIRLLADPTSLPGDFKRPGHIFPLRYREGGVVRRPGHTEASVDLARLAGCYPAGALCEIVNREDGSMARTPQLLEFAREHNLKAITIADLIKYIEKNSGQTP